MRVITKPLHARAAKALEINIEIPWTSTRAQHLFSECLGHYISAKILAPQQLKWCGGCMLPPNHDAHIRKKVGQAATESSISHEWLVPLGGPKKCSQYFRPAACLTMNQGGHGIAVLPWLDFITHCGRWRWDRKGCDASATRQITLFVLHQQRHCITACVECFIATTLGWFRCKCQGDEVFQPGQ